ncbi:hypothetical protein [Streptomyces sp. DH12]|uniref:hypothetical protein n=1 Tax=Streptomyces sp. DH12 TaxID=2857010 RepID=UPI001E29E158|nr:hypothetical protein [Streptomyces sp. DH12]
MTRLVGRALAAPLMAAALLTAPVTATAHAAPKPKEATRTIEWVAVLKSHTKPARLREGADWTVYAHLHLKARDGRPGKKIGDTTAHCAAILVNQRGHVTQCSRVLRTDAGHLSLTETMDRYGKGPHTAPAAVTGGTGAYADAEGEATVVLHGDIATFRIVLDD